MTKEEEVNLLDLHRQAVIRHGEYIAADLALENETKETVTPDSSILDNKIKSQKLFQEADNSFIDYLRELVEKYK